MKLIKILTILCLVISGGCLMVIGFRKKLPLFGAILSPKLKEDLDYIDKRLALIALLFFFVFYSPCFKIFRIVLKAKGEAEGTGHFQQGI